MLRGRSWYKLTNSNSEFVKPLQYIYYMYYVLCTVGSYLVQFVFASIFILCSVRMLAARILRQASARYTDANAKRPMVVQGVTAGSITALGDVIMQQMERRHAKVHLLRHLRAKRSACSLAASSR
jgi:hypothetical protein